MVYADKWSFLVPDLICDLDHGLLWKIYLYLEAIAASTSDIPSLLELLQRRKSDTSKSKLLCLSIMGHGGDRRASEFTGTQFKVLAEYAPSQCIPKPWTKKDGREGTIFKDPEYLEFLELLTKSAENLPSGEIQHERRGAERVGAAKEASIVTPLMDFVSQKRAAMSGFQGISLDLSFSSASDMLLDERIPCITSEVGLALIYISLPNLKERHAEMEEIKLELIHKGLIQKHWEGN